MKINVKILLLSIVAALLLAYLVGVVVWSSSQVSTTTCSVMEWTIKDSAERQYVTKNELTLLLQKQGLYPVGQKVNQIPTQRIENAILSHPMVRKAQCYVTPSGKVHIRLSQRVPILRVVTADESYFVDSDRKRMPIRASVTTEVMPVIGCVKERMATHEIADMVEWIVDNDYWHGEQIKIQDVHIVNPKYIYLTQSPDGSKIILGEVNGYKRKLNKLQTLYEEGFDKIGWRNYSEIDLRYRDQVVGRN